MFKKIIKNVLTKTGAGAPEAPASLGFDRSSAGDIPIYEGQWLRVWLKPDSYEIGLFSENETNGDELVGISHDYGLARYLMRYDGLAAKVIEYSREEVKVAIKYN